MNRIFGKCISFALCLVMLVGLCAFPSMAAEEAPLSGSCGETVTWTLDPDAKTLTIRGSGAMASYSQSSLSPWMAHKDLIETLVVKDGITAIGENAFAGCIKLGEVSLPDGLKTIGSYAFRRTIIENIDIPATVTELGAYTFAETPLTKIAVPEGVARLYEGVFMGCSLLTDVTLPASLTRVDEKAFLTCGVKNVYYGGTAEQWEKVTVLDYNTPLNDAEIHYAAEENPLGQCTDGSEHTLDNVQLMPPIAATCTEAGRKGGIMCPTCEKVLQEPTVVASTGHDYFKGVCKVCGEADPEYDPNARPDNPFKDVNAQHYFYDAVLWAVENDITTGTSAVTFSPNATCTRSQVVTFLHRAYGTPTPTVKDHPFKDVVFVHYFYDAVLWAVEQNITGGTTRTTFSPNATCTRAQVAAFLWRANGSPKMTDVDNPFVDVAKDAYYYDAVLWAVANGITTGTSAKTFSPNATCTRSQVVTFLHRALGD